MMPPFGRSNRYRKVYPCLDFFVCFPVVVVPKWLTGRPVLVLFPRSSLILDGRLFSKAESRRCVDLLPRRVYFADASLE